MPLNSQFCFCGRHQQGPRFEARTFVLPTMYEHRASKRQTSLRSFARGVAFSDNFINAAELCMALTVASRHCVPNAPVRLHKAATYQALLWRRVARSAG